MDEHQIGETFWYHGKQYRVEKSRDCIGCSFWMTEGKDCCKGFDMEPCGYLLRKDLNSVIFVEVKNNSKE